MKRALIFLCMCPATAWTQQSAAGSTIVGQLIFWTGALAVVVLVARTLFKEQFHERKTLRRLIDELGPRYREFDIDVIKRWVHQCAPHVWRAYDTQKLDEIQAFVTPFFSENFQSIGPQQIGPKGEKLIFDRILKIHPLGLYMVDDTAPPNGIELMLRLEEKVRLFSPIATGSDQKERFTQIQTFWTLRHSGSAWRLDRVWQAEGDVTDLAARTQVPPVTEWG